MTGRTSVIAIADSRASKLVRGPIPMPAIVRVRERMSIGGSPPPKPLTKPTRPISPPIRVDAADFTIVASPAMSMTLSTPRPSVRRRISRSQSGTAR
jgi:hypothetical protein